MGDLARGFDEVADQVRARQGLVVRGDAPDRRGIVGVPLPVGGDLESGGVDVHEGDPSAGDLCEQPGDEEDLQGRPFVGPAGRLLRVDTGKLSAMLSSAKTSFSPMQRRLLS